jgi:hypothetical protein
MRNVRYFPAEEKRVEDGAIQFGNDWPGLFIRGDSAFKIALGMSAVERMLEQYQADHGTPHPEWLAIKQALFIKRLIDQDVVVTQEDATWMTDPDQK